MTKHFSPGDSGGGHGEDRHLEVNYDLNGKDNDRTTHIYRAL